MITLATKPSASAKAEEQQLRAKLPQLTFAQGALMSKLQQVGINFNQDIKPLYANPIVFGDDSTSLTAFQDHFLIVWVTNDAGKLNALIKKAGHLQSAGSHDGAKLYTTAGGGALAVTGPTILFAKTTSDLTGALDRHAGGSGITESQYSSAVSGLPQDAAVHLYGNLAAVLSTPQAAQARRVPWVVGPAQLRRHLRLLDIGGDDPVPPRHRRRLAVAIAAALRQRDHAGRRGQRAPDSGRPA